ncbi:hypothetical protein V8C86DRAFT_276775 [Haematococcus lacustris]
MLFQLCKQIHLCLVRASPAPAVRPKHKRFRQTACMPRASTSGLPEASTAELTQYMSLLSEDEQADVLSKFVAAGFVGAKQKMVPRLSNQELECIGRFRHTEKLMQANVQVGQGSLPFLTPASRSTRTPKWGSPSVRGWPSIHLSCHPPLRRRTLSNHSPHTEKLMQANVRHVRGRHHWKGGPSSHNSCHRPLPRTYLATVNNLATRSLQYLLLFVHLALQHLQKASYT